MCNRRKCISSSARSNHKGSIFALLQSSRPCNLYNLCPNTIYNYRLNHKICIVRSSQSRRLHMSCIDPSSHIICSWVWLRTICKHLRKGRSLSHNQCISLQPCIEHNDQSMCTQHSFRPSQNMIPNKKYSHRQCIRGNDQGMEYKHLILE